MISKKFIKSSFIYSFIGALPLASSIILLPFYTNYLSTSDFGIFSLFLGFTALVQILVNLTIDQYLVYSYYDSKDNFQKVKEIVGTSVAILLVWGAFVSLIFYLFGSSIFDLYNTYLTKETKEIKFFPYGFFCVLTAVFNSLFQSYKGLLIAQQKPIQYFWFNISNFFLTVGISLGGLFLYPYTLVGPMYGRLLSGVAIFILALLSFIINFGLTFQKKLLKNIYKFCFPLFFNSNVIWVIGYLGVFIINYYTCSSDVAIYNFIISTTFLIEFLQNGLTNAIYPKIFDLWTRDKINSNSKEVNKYFNAYTGISLLIIPLFVLIIPIIVPVFVLNTDFLQGFTFLLLISVAFTFRGIQNIYFTSIMYLKKTKRIAKINLYTSIIQIVVSVVLIKQFGLSGAFWAFMVVKPVQTLIFYLETKKLFQYNMNYTKQVFIPLVYVALAIILYPFYFKFNIHILNLIQLTVIWTITFLVYKNEIINLIRYFFLKKHSLTNVKS